MVQKAVSPRKAISELEELSVKRYKMARKIYEEQDGLTKEVIDRIRDRIAVATTGVVNVNGRPYKLGETYIGYNNLFMAVEIISDLALMNIKVANFKPSKLWCANCRRSILKVKKGKAKSR